MDPLTVLTAFKQQGEGTCKAIALIKVAIARFGVGNVFTTTYPAGGPEYTVTLRNGKQVKFTDIDYDHIKARCGFVVTNDIDIYNYAVLCFVVYLRHYMDLQDCNEDDALAAVDKGGGVEATGAYEYLGFEDADVTQLTDDNGTTDATVFAQNPLYLLCNNIHVVMGVLTQYDEYGTPCPATEFTVNHHRVLHPIKDKVMWAFSFV